MSKGHNPFTKSLPALVIACLGIGLSAAKENKHPAGADRELDSLRALVKQMAAGDAALMRNIATFDTLDFTVYSGQQWMRMHESHAKDVKVHFADGHTTIGLDKHIEELKWNFAFSPSTKISEHPIKFGDKNGEWTAVTGITEGAFTKPMPMPDGTSIPPTGKPFKFTMCTIGHWKNGVMVEEWLFWDSQSLMKQLGLAK